MNALDQERLDRAAASAVIPAGSIRFAQASRDFGFARAWRRLLAGQLDSRLVRSAQARLDGRDPHAVAIELIEKAKRAGARFVIPSDPEWSVSLGDLEQLADDHDAKTAAPVGLWVRGASLRKAADRAVAVVGARAATPYGLHVARELGFGLAEREWTVVSGAAYGIDGAAHRGALAAGGITVAVLAHGIDGAYPPGNAGLLEHIAENGVVVSEWPVGVPPARHRFLVRNRLIAALAAGTVVVEAARRSGSRLTARRALELSRQVMAVPGPITAATSVGTHALIREWRAELVTDVDDVIELVGELGSSPGGQQARNCASIAPQLPEDQPAGITRTDPARSDFRPADLLDPNARKVLDAVLGARRVELLQLIRVTGLERPVVVGALSMLRMCGFVVEEERVGGAASSPGQGTLVRRDRDGAKTYVVGRRGWAMVGRNAAGVVRASADLVEKPDAGARTAGGAGAGARDVVDGVSAATLAENPGYANDPGWAACAGKDEAGVTAIGATRAPHSR